MQFVKEGCFTCENVKDNVNKKIKALNLEGKVDYKIYYLNKPTEEGLVNAALYNVPFDTVPTLVIAGKGSYWKKTTKYAPKQDKTCADNPCNINTTPIRSDLIRASEIEEQLKILGSQYE
jgi:glutaredoxin